MATLRYLARACDFWCYDELKQEKKLSILHKAAFEGDKKKVMELITSGVDVNINDKNNWTPLHDAAIQGHDDIVRILINAGANINARDKEEAYTPLHDAVVEGHICVVKRLLESGADVNIVDKWGISPLEDAKKRGHLKIADLFLE